MVGTILELLEVDLKFSGIYQYLVIGIYSVAMAALWLASISAMGSLLLSLCVLLHAYYYRMTFTRLAQGSVPSGIRFYKDSWRIRLSNDWVQAWPCGQAFVGSTMMFLPFRVQTSTGVKKYRIVIFPDSADQEQIHALRLTIVLKGFVNTSN